MEQFEFFEVPSPCIGVCQTDARGYCKGCLRSREERFNWINYSNSTKQEVITILVSRKRRRMLALLKARDSQKLKTSAANDFFDKDTEELVQSVLEQPALIETLDEDRLNLLWAFLKYFFMPLLVGAILIVFQQNYEYITAHLSEAKDVESLKTLVKNGTILTISGNWAVVTTNSLNFRKEAGLSSTILANLKLGEPVEVIDDMGQDWLYVRAMIDDELKSGWIHKDYVVSIKPSPRKSN